jgi:hypothetical protein
MRTPSRATERLFVLLLAGALGVGAVRTEARTGAERRELLRGYEATALAGREPGLRRELERTADAATGKRLLARALIVDAWTARGAADAARVEGLDRARRLAAEALALRPASAEAAMLLGLAIQLGWDTHRDARLYGQRGVWEAPLRAAIALAPGDEEPRRALAGSLLAIWFALPHAEREETRHLLRDAFREPATFERLVAAWVDAAWRPHEVFSIMPEAPAAWDLLEAVYARRAAWAEWGDAHRRHLAVLRRDLDRRLAEATRLLAEGEARAARRGFLEILAQAPPQRAFADLAAAALERCPAGVTEPRYAPPLRRWLEWALDRLLYGQPGLAPAALARLAAASGDLPEELLALSALAAGELRRAELLEEQAQAQWSESWGVYLIAKARRLAERGDVAAAHRALAQVHRNWQASPSYWLAREAVAVEAAQPEAVREAQRRLRSLAADRWPAIAWRQVGGRALLEGLLAAPRGEATLGLDVVPPRGAVVEVEADGASLGIFAVSPRESTLRLALEAGPGLHLFELRTLAGEKVAPGELSTAADAGL